MAAGRTHARFAEVGLAAAHYESFYLKACHPDGGLGVWLRSTVRKPAGAPAVGSLWCTLFDVAAPGPVACKATLPAAALGVPDGGYLRIGEARFTPGRVEGGIAAAGCEASWALGFTPGEPALAHLGGALLYRAPLPRTKLETPHPAARFDGTVAVGGRLVELHGWPGMVGHNWGTQHAERWVWLHGAGFAGHGDGTWLDVAVARVRVGGRLTPWAAAGALSLGGARHRLGGPGRAVRLAETPDGCDLTLAGRGVRLRGVVRAARKDLVGWSYADPDGSLHDVVNCSVATMRLTVERRGHPAVELQTAGGAAYELGMREHDHGVPLQPFPDAG